MVGFVLQNWMKQEAGGEYRTCQHDYGSTSREKESPQSQEIAITVELDLTLNLGRKDQHLVRCGVDIAPARTSGRARIGVTNAEQQSGDGPDVLTQLADGTYTEVRVLAHLEDPVQSAREC
ncbi:unnamed protein product [Prorocentrum cordatum]|uniref:Uncharacterized protein n=1 Tax=Prorocentrum cordatum TaxID=2364126 RepID=A0ABN9QAC9_9DINO|nr:unnamed protein product [Polarella glacialis]